LQSLALPASLLAPLPFAPPLLLPPLLPLVPGAPLPPLLVPLSDPVPEPLDVPAFEPEPLDVPAFEPEPLPPLPELWAIADVAKPIERADTARSFNITFLLWVSLDVGRTKEESASSEIYLLETHETTTLGRRLLSQKYPSSSVRIEQKRSPLSRAKREWRSTHAWETNACDISHSENFHPIKPEGRARPFGGSPQGRDAWLCLQGA
jgi:hypothetical protein